MKSPSQFPVNPGSPPRLSGDDQRTKAPRSYRKRAARWVAAACLGGSSLFMGGCCQDDLCAFMRIYLAVLSNKVTTCCSMPPAEQTTCLTGVSSWQDGVFSKIVEAYNACRTGEEKRFDELIKHLWELVPKNAVTKSASGGLENSLPILLATDLVSMDITANACDIGKKITTIDVNGKNLLPEAAGKHAAEAVAWTGASAGTAVARIVLSSDPTATVSRSYCLPSEAGVHAVWAGRDKPFAVSGSIALSDLKPDAGGVLSGFPTEATITLSDGNSKIAMSLDKTVPENQIAFVGASGRLMMAMSVDARTSSGAHFPPIYQTVWVSLPVERATDGSWLRLNTGGNAVGSTIFPADPIMLNDAGLGEPTTPPVPPPVVGADPCGYAPGTTTRNIIREYFQNVRNALGEWCKITVP